ncbi:hypothetical protein AVEN_250861-1 [Araneus ventricosus]|uniref:Uncharacterized protein n=1 Tax=Araneus ventricosus TaxID=182803 RepID=A0A4Y2INK9_ARAVE|nr:hypothetical protein AVEN_250861-1 [Araneus ventricosus]
MVMENKRPGFEATRGLHCGGGSNSTQLHEPKIHDGREVWHRLRTQPEDSTHKILPRIHFPQLTMFLPVAVFCTGARGAHLLLEIMGPQNLPYYPHDIPTMLFDILNAPQYPHDVVRYSECPTISPRCCSIF